MPTERLKCNTCDALILPSTFDKCGGLCMQCFMKENDGYRPAELNSLRERCLYSYFERWNQFKEKSLPSVESNDTINKLCHYIPVIHASVSGFLRVGEGRFDGSANIELLIELKCISDGKLKEYVSELEAFYQELIDVTKT